MPEAEFVFSVPRLATYLRVAQGDLDKSLELYAWNAQVSAGLMLYANFAEVAVRNAVDDALVSIYGAQWPWNSTFEQSLPAPKRGFSTRNELINVRGQHPSTGKVIADLRFVFWEKMFTARFDQRIWTPHIHRVFPGAGGYPVSQTRTDIHSDLWTVRQIRNRIAHHEPLLSVDLNALVATLERLVSRRSPDTCAWLKTFESATSLIAARPQA